MPFRVLLFDAFGKPFSKAVTVVRTLRRATFLRRNMNDPAPKTSQQKPILQSLLPNRRNRLNPSNNGGSWAWCCCCLLLVLLVLPVLLVVLLPLLVFLVVLLCSWWAPGAAGGAAAAATSGAAPPSLLLAGAAGAYNLHSNAPERRVSVRERSQTFLAWQKVRRNQAATTDEVGMVVQLEKL